MKNNQFKQIRTASAQTLFAVVLMLLTAVAAFPSSSQASSAGALDETFGNGGFASTSIYPDTGDSPFVVIVQPDGKILAAGFNYNQTVVGSFIVRYNTNGTLDRNFGTNGILRHAAGEFYQVIELQPDGKIVAAGYRQTGAASTADFAVARFNADGTLDASFGAGGKVVTAISAEQDEASAVMVQPDGKIVAVGFSMTSGANFDFAAVRYNSNGTIDATFGRNGRVVADMTGGNDFVDDPSAVLQPDGKIVIGGYGGTSAANTDFLLARLNADGSLDASFGAGGKVVTALSANKDSLWDLALQPDGKIIASGSFNYVSGSSVETALVRYNANGSIDTTFAQNGVRSISWNSDGYYVGNAVALQPNGKIVAFGFGIVPTSGASISGNAAQTERLFAENNRRKENLGRSNNVHRRKLTSGESESSALGGDDVIGFAAARFNADGALDTTFGSGGKVITPVGYSAYAYGFGVALQPDGKIVGCGTAYGYSVVVRYHGDSIVETPSRFLDRTFGATGKVITDLPDSNYARQIEVQPDGKSIVLAWQRDESFNLLGTYLIRYNRNGSIDDSFGSGGAVRVNCQTECFEDGFVIMPDGKILVVGEAKVSGVWKFAVFRLNADGKRDASWGTNGAVTIPIVTGNSYGHEILVQPDGKIVVLGPAQRAASSTFDIGIARLNPTGTLDATFGNGGVSVIANNTDLFRMPEIRLQADGKFLFLIQSSAVVGAGRINADGTLDTGFASNGFIAVETSGWNVQALALQPDGKIILAWTFFNGDTTNSFVGRFNRNGTPDTTFGANGRAEFPGNANDAMLIRAVVVQPNGGIIVGGNKREDPIVNFFVMRLNSDGSVDRNFGRGGIAVVPGLGIASSIASMKIQPDGKLIAVGQIFTDANSNAKVEIGLARFLLDSPRTHFDFDGDGRADTAVYRAGVWYVSNSSNGGFRAEHFGLPTDKIAPADYDGDGRTDIAVYRDGTWYWINSSDNQFRTAQFGQSGDIPVPADYTGDGRAELAVFRRGVWYTLDLADNRFTAIQFGISTDKPVPADYDGDGRTDPAVYRDGRWFLLQSRDGFTVINFGLGFRTNTPVPADYDGDGRADVAVFRNGTWYVWRSSSSFAEIQFGLSSDVPVPADYDGDGSADIAVFRDGTWYFLKSASGFAAQQFGLPTDKPIPSAFAP